MSANRDGKEGWKDKRLDTEVEKGREEREKGGGGRGDKTGWRGRRGGEQEVWGVQRGGKNRGMFERSKVGI